MTLKKWFRRARESGRLIRYCLIVSLAFNLLVVGIFVGAIAGHDRRSHGWNPAGMSIRPLINALPDAERTVLIDRLREARKSESEDAGEVIRRNVELLASAIEADPYEAETVLSAFQSQRESFGRLGAKGHSAIVDVISELSLEDRIALAGAFRENAYSRRKHRLSGNRNANGNQVVNRDL